VRYAIGHGIDGIENEIGEGVAQPPSQPMICGSSSASSVRIDDDAALLGADRSSGSREVDDLLETRLHATCDSTISARAAIESRMPRDGLSDVLDGGLNGDQTAARRSLKPARAPTALGVQRRRGDRVVDIVRDTARHLPQRPQRSCWHDRLLRLAQIVVGALQLP